MAQSQQKKNASQYESEARIHRVLASAKRLGILYALEKGERSVEELRTELHLPKANASQHLAALRHAGLVKVRRAATRAYYRLADPAILDCRRHLRRFF